MLTAQQVFFRTTQRSSWKNLKFFAETKYNKRYLKKYLLWEWLESSRIESDTKRVSLQVELHDVQLTLRGADAFKADKDLGTFFWNQLLLVSFFITFYGQTLCSRDKYFLIDLVSSWHFFESGDLFAVSSMIGSMVESLVSPKNLVQSFKEEETEFLGGIVGDEDNSDSVHAFALVSLHLSTETLSTIIHMDITKIK